MMNLPWDHADWADRAAPTPELARQLACFDMAQACELLAPLCADAGPAIAARVLNVWYTPPSRLLLVIELTLRGGATERFTVRVGDRAPPASARTRPAAVSTADPSAVVDSAMRSTDAGSCAAADTIEPGTELPAWQARAWRLPADPGGLPLAQLLDPAYSAQRLGAAGVALQAPTEPARLLSYLPGQRLALRLGDDAAAASEAAVVLKCQQGAAATHAAMLALWRSPLRGFAMAEPLAVDGEMSTRWERFVPGRRVEAVAQDQGWTTSLQRLMPALVALHHSAVPGLGLQRPADVLARLQGKVHKRVAAALPRHLPALNRQFGELTEWMTPPPQPTATLHGDLHTGNLLFTPHGEVVFIDLDSLVRGDPAYDLALLSTRLLLLALMGRADPAQMVELAVRLPQWYVSAGGDTSLPARYPWHVATLLLSRQLKTCIRHCAPDMDALAESLLGAAASVLRKRAVDHTVLDSCLATS